MGVNPGWGKGSRLLLLALLLTLITPAPILVTPGPRQQVQSNHPILAVHTRLTDEVEPWKIQQTLRMVREMGATGIVEFFPWAYYEQQPGSIDWRHPDFVMNHAQAQDLRVIARLGLTPDWARPEETPLNYLDSDGYQHFAAFAAAFARRYQDRVDAVIIWNEPNLSFEWGYRETTPADYVALLRETYPAVRAAAPDMLVLAGALAPTLEPSGSPWGLDDLRYLEGMYEAGAAPYFDALAVHTYGLTFPPETEPEPDLINFRRVELLREIMEASGDEAKHIFITETGWNDHPRWSRAVSPAQRIQYTLDAVRYAEENWPYVEMMALWAFRFPAPTRSFMDYYTLVTPEFVEKPVYQALQEFTGNE